MSRVTGGTDGTAEASWAASGTATGTGTPSANLSGRRVGTPGAANTLRHARTPMDDDPPDDEMMDYSRMAPAADSRLTS